MTREDTLSGTVLDDAALSLEDLARACRTDETWVVTRVETGVLSCARHAPARMFSGRDLARARRIRALELSFDADPELAAMVADLIDEMERLRAALRRAGLTSS